MKGREAVKEEEEMLWWIWEGVGTMISLTRDIKIHGCTHHYWHKHRHSGSVATCSHESVNKLTITGTEKKVSQLQRGLISRTIFLSYLAGLFLLAARDSLAVPSYIVLCDASRPRNGKGGKGERERGTTSRTLRLRRN